MVRGFYNLTSGMLTQSRRLDVISQNMVNTSTAGYKADTYHEIAYQEYTIQRIGNTRSSEGVDIGPSHFKTVSQEISTDYTQGAMEETMLPLDFALQGDGFYAVQWEWPVETDYSDPDYDPNADLGTEETISYTRSGSFSIDEEGYLFLPNFGYVLDGGENRIMLGTDKILCDEEGNIYNEETGALLATLGVFTFPDNAELERDTRGMFIGEGAQAAEAGSYSISQGFVERANVDLMSEMVLMMATQKAYQACATMSKIYDQVLTKITTEIGRGG